MSDIAPLQQLAASAFDYAARASRPRQSEGSAGRAGDSVELSSAATFLAKLRTLPPRQGLVDSVRAEIESGTYDSDDRFDAALDALLEDLDTF